MTARTTKPSPDRIAKITRAKADSLDDGSPNGKLKAEFVRAMAAFRAQHLVVQRHRKRGDVEKETLALVDLREVEDRAHALADRLVSQGIDPIAIAKAIAGLARGRTQGVEDDEPPQKAPEPEVGVRIVPDHEEEHWSRLELWCVGHQTWHVAARGETELMMILLAVAKQAEGARR